MATEKMIEAWRGVGSDGVSDLTDRQDIADQWLADGIEVTPLVAALSTDAEPVAFMWSDTSNGQGYDTKFSEYPPAPSPYISGEITPLYAAPPAPSVAVKALEWVQSEYKTTWTAQTPFGHYFVHKIRALDFSVFHDGKSSWSKKGIYLSEVQAAAQADYEARIRSALSAQVQDVAAPALKIGIYRKAYDRPEDRRAYTYDDQPDNVGAHKMGRACSEIHSGGDWIDRGLNLLNALQREGFGVFELPAAPAAKQGEAE